MVEVGHVLERRSNVDRLRLSDNLFEHQTVEISAWQDNVDDLKEVVAKNQARRKHKVIQAEMLLRIELQKFEAWQESLKYVPTISRLQAKMEKVRAAETAKTMKKGLKGLSDKERQAVETVTKGIINKLLHGPMTCAQARDTRWPRCAMLRSGLR